MAGPRTQLADTHSTPARARAPWAWWVLLLLLAGLALPFDGPLSAWFVGWPDLSSDPRRVAETLREFGQGASIVLVCVLIWLLDPARRRWLLDLLAGIATVGAATVALKILLARTRPKHGDPWQFLGPVKPWDFGDGREHHSWEVGHQIVSELWSMPSNHAAFAAMLSVFLAWYYPRLRGLVIALTAVVAVGRVTAGAHYPSDVLAGLALGWAGGWLAVRNAWGVRAVDWIWKRLVNRRAVPAHPALARAEAARRAREAAG
jgi:membrane-associated phospholipid phosphatase